MSIEYIHTAEVHTLAGPAEALPILFAEQKPNSLLDVGCGTGTWLKAAIDFGIPEVLGLEGIEISPGFQPRMGRFRQGIQQGPGVP